MESTTRTLRIPDGLGDDSGHEAKSTSEGAIVSYTNEEGIRRQWVLVCAPTAVYVRHGQKLLEVEGRREEVHAGRVLLMRRGLYMMSEMVDGARPYASTLLSVQDGFLNAFHERFGDAHAGSVPMDRAWCAFTPDDYLRGVFEQLPQVMRGKGHPNLLGVKIEELVLAMQHPLAQGFWRAAGREAASSGDARLRDAVTRHTFSGATAAELATLSNRSLSSFKRDFRRLYGAPPGRWLLEQRLERAAGLLSTRECNVTEACWRAGFADVSSFIRAFKRVYGITPKRFQLAHVRAVNTV